MALSIHSYQPEGWAGIGDSRLPVSGTWTLSSITGMMNGVQREANRLGMPVVMGEWGSVARNEDPNHTSERDSGEGSRGHHVRVYVREATSRGFATVMWDTGLRGSVMMNEGRFGIFDRASTSQNQLVYLHVPAAARAGYTEAGGLAANVRAASIAHTSPITGMTFTPTNSVIGVSRWSLESALLAA
jgi:hypothetical protein